MILSHKINKPADVVFDYLTDVTKYVSVHPVITRIESKGGNSYLVFETLKFGFVPYSFTYPATVESNKEIKRVVMKATVMKINRIEMIFSIMAEKGYTIVDEEIRFETFLPIKSIMQRIFRKQHSQLFKNMERINEGWKYNY